MTRVMAALFLSAAALADEPPASPPPTPAETTGTATAAAPPSADAAGAPESPQPPTAPILPLDSRMEAYAQFRSYYETEHYQDALPFAQRVVELSESDPARDYELPVAYNNLAATQYQLGDYPAAEASYKQSLDILESTQGISSRRLIVPLAGLGAVYAALDQHGMAVEKFDRAIAVSRRSEGLFNLAQLPMLELAAHSRMVLGDLYGVEHDLYYSVRIAEQNYGYSDPRTVPPAMRLAKFYEDAEQFAAARMMWMRVRDITLAEKGGFNPLAVKSLVAVCRTHRMQYTLEPETIDDEASQVRNPVTGEPSGGMYRSARVPAPAADRAGLKSAELALEILRAIPDPPPELMTETLIELGDWFQSIARPNNAMPYYAEAAAIFAAHPDGDLVNPLFEPRMIFYRAPLASRRGATDDSPHDLRVRSAEFSLSVSETGDTGDITVVTSDMQEGQLSQSRRALARAIYSPRFENGRPVATQGVRFVTNWYEQVPAEKPPAQNPATPSEPAPATQPAEPAPVSGSGS